MKYYTHTAIPKMRKGGWFYGLVKSQGLRAWQIAEIYPGTGYFSVSKELTRGDLKMMLRDINRAVKR